MAAYVLAICRDLGNGLTVYGVLSRGLLGGQWSKERCTTPGDFRLPSPRFQGQNLERNLQLLDAPRRVADEKGVTVAQLDSERRTVA